MIKIKEKMLLNATIADREMQILKLNQEICELKVEVASAKIKMHVARGIILKLYNAGRDILMCHQLPYKQDILYKRLSDCINDKSIEQILKELK